MKDASDFRLKGIYLVLLATEALKFVSNYSFHSLLSVIYMYCLKLHLDFSLPRKRLVFSPPHKYEVRVLLTELYPNACEIFGSSSCRSNDITEEDYILCLQKMAFDGLETELCGNSDHFYQSNSSSAEVQLKTEASNPDIESQSIPMATTSTCQNDSPDLDSAPRLLVSVGADKDEMILPSQRSESVQSVRFDPESSENVTDFDRFESDYEESQKLKVEAPESGTDSRNGPLPLFIPRDPPADPLVPVYVGPFNRVSANPNQPRPVPVNGVLRSISNNRRPVAQGSPVPGDSFVWPRYDRPNRPYSTPQSSINKASHASSWRDHFCEVPEEEEEEDEDEQDDIEFRRDPEPPSNELEDSDEGEQDDYDDEDDEDYEEPQPRFKMEEAGGVVRRYSRHNSLSPSSSCGQRSSLTDRTIRDIAVLRQLKVPFTYDEIAYSPNEQFRAMKATPGLKYDQITAMLDARRRATNRQAAERCRRVKSAARDSLATEVDRLRSESDRMSSKLNSVRHRRQQAWDELKQVQRRLLEHLVDSDGVPLDPSEWRVQMTNEGEIVVVHKAEAMCGRGTGSDGAVGFHRQYSEDVKMAVDSVRS